MWVNSRVIDHTGASTMYLMGFVNSTFQARRPTGNLELVDLLLEKKYHPPEHKEVGNLSNGHLQNGSMAHSNGNGNGYGNRILTSTKIDKGNGNGGAIPDVKPIARPRRLSVEDLPADIYMEALCPFVSRSPEVERKAISCLPEETSVYVLEKDVGLDPDWSFWDMAQAGEQDTVTTLSRMTAISNRLAVKLARVFAEGGLATRVQHHPLETADDTDSDRDSRARDSIIAVSSCEKRGDSENVEISPTNTDDSFTKILRRLERIEGSVKNLKTRADDAKLRIEQSESQEPGPRITTPPSEDADEPREILATPLLSSPVMGKTAAPELPYSWNKNQAQNLPKLSSVESEPMMEERDLQYLSPPITESGVQEVPSFRLREPAPKPRRSILVSKDYQELDLETALDLVADEYAKSKNMNLTLGSRMFANSCDSLGKDEGGPDDSTKNVKPSPSNSDAPLHLKTFDLSSRGAKPKVDVGFRRCEEGLQQEYPSPSSFTCKLSPTSSFSDDQEPFQMSVSGDDNMFSKLQPFPNVSKSPRSVLSPKESDETSHFTSDSSETREEDRQPAYVYNDESSDLESPMEAKNVGTALTRRPFPTFTYSVGKEMGETSSDDDPESATRDDTSTLGDANAAGLVESQDENRLQPWLGNVGGMSDDSDFEFLLSPDPRTKDTTSEVSPLCILEQQIQCPASELEVSEMADRKAMHESPRRPRCQNTWVPYVTGEPHDNNRSPVRSPPCHGKDKVPVASLPRGEEETPQSRPPKRSVNFAPDLVKEMASPDRKQPLPVPRAANPNVKHPADESGPPGAKTWEVEEGPSIMSSRRRWRRNGGENLTSSPGGSSRAGSSSWGQRSGRRERVAQVVPCAGRLFSWPQRLAFKVRKSRRMDSDDESVVGDRVNDSFGMSARRDAEQVRRILKGSQKKYSNLSVADIMKQDFGNN